MAPSALHRTALLLGLVVLLAAVPRLASVSFNAWPHGDVLLDAAIVDAVSQQGELKVPLVDVRFYPISRFGFGYPPDQHPPLWPILGAAIRFVWPDSYEALKLLSLLAGLLLLPAVYRCGLTLFGAGPALFATALCAVSYLMIDFSGNGSLWSLLALLYVVFVWQLAYYPAGRLGTGVLLGLTMGAAYLTNYPAVVLPASYAAVAAIRVLQPTNDRSTRDKKDVEAWSGLQPAPRFPRSAIHLALPLLVAGLVVSPWLAFNTATFGNPVWSQPLQRQLGGGEKRVEVIVEDGEVVKQTVPASDPLTARLRTTVQNVYGNVGFLVRQSLALAPFFGGFAMAGLLLLTLHAARGSASGALPLLVLTVAHTALVLLWPTTKFRYLVPLFPLAALIGGWLLWQVHPVHLRRLLATVALGAGVFTSVWTFASIPSHTYYYNGGVVTDNFGGQGEIAYVEELRRMEEAAAVIRATGPGAMLGPHSLYAMVPGQPLVINSTIYRPEVVEHLVRQYRIRYVVAESTWMPFYAGLLPGQTIWLDDRFGVFEVRSQESNGPHRPSSVSN